MARTLLTLGVALVILLCVAAMAWGYRNRRARQAYLPAFPQPPDGAADREHLLPAEPGVYVSTTTAASWQDRVAVGDVGFRSKATAHLVADGLLLERTGASPLWIPADALRAARVGQALAGKVMFGDGLLIVRWELAGREFDTGFLAENKGTYPAWVRAINETTTGNGLPGGSAR